MAWNQTYDSAVSRVLRRGHGAGPCASGGGKSESSPVRRTKIGVKNVVGDRRGVPDVSMNAAAVMGYHSFGGLPSGWSLGGEHQRVDAGVRRDRGAGRPVAGHPLGLLNPRLYALSARHAPGIVDVTSGSNTVTFQPTSNLVTIQGYPARKGYDLVTGIGTINALPFVHGSGPLAQSGEPGTRTGSPSRCWAAHSRLDPDLP